MSRQRPEPEPWTCPDQLTFDDLTDSPTDSPTDPTENPTKPQENT